MGVYRAALVPTLNICASEPSQGFHECGKLASMEQTSLCSFLQAGVHPEQPGNTVDRAAFERIWQHSVLLLQRGFKSGSILTVDPEEAAVLGPPWTRRCEPLCHTVAQ